ncbi:MAG: dTDP-4-dehydrorhamnose 3,5-epimerase [Oligoflexus sp.]
MKVFDCKIPGLKLIEPQVFCDQRGYFMESYHKHRYQETGIMADLVQDNLSYSRYGVLRGLHIQNPKSQGKLVTVLEGEVFDVAVDLRRGSPAFGKWYGVRLSSENKKQFWIPRGFAHGFVVVSKTALFVYKCDEYYQPDSDLTIQWNDPDIDIHWPIHDPVLSPKDRTAKRLCEFNDEDLPSFEGTI